MKCTLLCGPSAYSQSLLFEVSADYFKSLIHSLIQLNLKSMYQKEKNNTLKLSILLLINFFYKFDDMQIICTTKNNKL